MEYYHNNWPDNFWEIIVFKHWNEFHNIQRYIYHHYSQGKLLYILTVNL